MIRVLYIDDEANSERMASKFELMRGKGIEVVPVCRVGDVLTTLTSIRDSLDVIILDLIMPPEDIYELDETEGGSLTGLRLLADIRHQVPKMPVIIVSVRTRPHPEHLFSQFGISDYVEKPVSASVLSEAIKSCVSGTKDGNP